MATSSKRGKRIKPELRDRVIELYMLGYTPDDIEAMTGATGKSIGGVLTAAKNRQAIPRGFVQPPRPVDAGASAASVPPSAAPGPLPEPASNDGFDWQPVPENKGGSGRQADHPTYFQVERREPASDKGVLGEYDHPLTDDEVGNLYGSGAYWVSKHEAGRSVVRRDVKISSAYGNPRTPRRDQPATPSRAPGYTPRMLERIRAARGIEDDDEGTPMRTPIQRRPYYPERPTPSRDDDDRSALADFARHGAQAGESIAVAAVQQLGKIQEMTLKQREEERKTGPQSFLTSFMEKQQNLDREQRANERQREEGRLSEERKRSEDARREEDRRWERRQHEQAEQHKRELQRIEKEAELREKVERERQSGMMDLYDKRMALAEKEAQNREDRIKAELDRTRQEAKEDREKLMAKLTEMSQQHQEQLGSMQEELKEELERERGNLKQHHDLKMKALENEHSLRSDMLKLREDMAKSQGGDVLEKVLSKLGSGVENIAKEVVDLKKIQAVSGLSPEAQAAHVDANVRGGVPGPEGGAAPVHAPTPVQAQPRVAVPAEEPQPRNGNGNGNGAKPKKEIANMESEVVANMNEPFFQEVLKEWALHVESGNDATAFANMFMEWMRDDSTPEAASSRKACGGFTTFISVRSWAQVLRVIEPALGEEQVKVFKTPEATEFYDQFRTMVVESVRDYWRSYLEAKRAAQQPPRGTTPSAEPAPAADPAAHVAPTGEGSGA